MAKINYACKNCGWTTSIREEWADLRPKRCMNKRCNTSFIKNPEALDVQAPPAPQVEEAPKVAPKKIKRQEVAKADE